jgi:hypothetical protein
MSGTSRTLVSKGLLSLHCLSARRAENSRAAEPPTVSAVRVQQLLRRLAQVAGVLRLDYAL